MTSSSIDWPREFPRMLTCRDLASIYPYRLRTIRNMAAQRNTKIPFPCGTRPFVFRRDDVMRHYSRLTA